MKHENTKQLRALSLQKQPPEVLIKKLFLKDSQCSQEGTRFWVSVWWSCRSRPVSLFKRDSNTVAFYCEISKNTYFEENLKTAVSVSAAESFFSIVADWIRCFVYILRHLIPYVFCLRAWSCNSSLVFVFCFAPLLILRHTLWANTCSKSIIK